MEKDGYSWWVRRLQRAQDLYDEFRIDHFRGFAGFWAVPSGELMFNWISLTTCCFKAWCHLYLVELLCRCKNCDDGKLEGLVSVI